MKNIIIGEFEFFSNSNLSSKNGKLICECGSSSFKAEPYSISFGDRREYKYYKCLKCNNSIRSVKHL